MTDRLEQFRLTPDALMLAVFDVPFGTNVAWSNGEAQRVADASPAKALWTCVEWFGGDVREENLLPGFVDNPAYVLEALLVEAGIERPKG